MDSNKGALLPGKVSQEQFDLLLSGTLIRSEFVINALRDHLVYGLSASRAWTKHGVNPSQFSRRHDVLIEESKRAAALSKFYR